MTSIWGWRTLGFFLSLLIALRKHYKLPTWCLVPYAEKNALLEVWALGVQQLQWILFDTKWEITHLSINLEIFRSAFWFWGNKYLKNQNSWVIGRWGFSYTSLLIRENTISLASLYPTLNWGQVLASELRKWRSPGSPGFRLTWRTKDKPYRSHSTKTEI